MKNTLIVMCLLMLGLGSNAQDLLITRNGDEIEAKILEITPDSVKYKRHSNIDGPLYTIHNNEVKEILFDNGEKEVFSIVVRDGDSRKAVFIKTTEDSKVDPTENLWQGEIERHSGLRMVNKLEEADLIFEFRLRRAMGEARVSVVVYDSDNNELWKSKRYRGTTNAFNRMSPTFHAIRKCMDKGVIREMDKGTF